MLYQEHSFFGGGVLFLYSRPNWDQLELQLHYNIHFRSNNLRKGMNYLIHSDTFYIVALVFFHKDGLSIK